MTSSAEVPVPAHWSAAIQALAAAAVSAVHAHPRCGAMVAFRRALQALPEELIPQVGWVGEHPEDDESDGAALIARLTAENAELRRRLELTATGDLL